MRTLSNRSALYALSLLLLVANQRGLSRQTVEVDTLNSKALGVHRLYSVLLPSPLVPSSRYPVLFLLHGYGGDHSDWLAKTQLRTYLAGVPLIVVMPDAENSWYANSDARPTDRYEEYVMSDLRQSVAQKYPVDTTREAIAGLSMGGYGAVMLAMKHPHAFQFAGSLSGAFSIPRFLEDSVNHPQPRALRAEAISIFGPPGSAHRNQYDPFMLFRLIPADSTCFFYFATGTDDAFRGFLPAQRMLTDSLRALRIPYEYHETPGNHSWKYWDREIRPLLVRLRENLKF